LLLLLQIPGSNNLEDMANNLRREFERLKQKYYKHKLYEKVTLSIGLSEYPNMFAGQKMNSFTRPIQPCIMQRTWEKTRYISIRTR